jgi:hypothetical protein
MAARKKDFITEHGSKIAVLSVAFLLLGAASLLPAIPIIGDSLQGAFGAITGAEDLKSPGTPSSLSPTNDVQKVQQVNTSTLTLVPYNKYAPGTAVDAECALLRGSSVIFDSDAVASETKALSPGEHLKVACWDDGQTTDLSGTAISLDSNNDWYGYLGDITVPFAPTATFPEDFETDFDGLYKEGTLSAYITNPDGTLNSSSAYALSAGQVKTFNVTLTGPNDASFGSPYSNKNVVVYFDYNTATTGPWDSIEVTSKGAKKVSVPDHNLGTADAAYELPFNSVADNAEATFKITVTVDGTYQPVAHFGEDINMWIADPTLYYDSTKGNGFKYGIEDEEDASLIGQNDLAITLDTS